MEFAICEAFNPLNPYSKICLKIQYLFIIGILISYILKYDNSISDVHDNTISDTLHGPTQSAVQYKHKTYKVNSLVTSG